MSSTGARTRCDAAMAAGVLGLGVFLAITGSGLVSQWRSSALRGQSVSFEDLIGAVAAVAGLLTVAWWTVSLLAAFAAALLELLGRQRAAAVTGSFSPMFMRRLAVAAVGLQLTAAPLAAAAPVPTDPAWHPTPPATVSAEWVPSEDPGNGSGFSAGDSPLAIDDARAVGTGDGVPAPAAPDTGRPAEAPPAAIDPKWTPVAPVTEPGLLAGSPTRLARQAAGADEVTVVAGESLWTIAARALGPNASDVDIAFAWPLWYQANRDVIGSDPDVLRPGQVLKAPAAS